MFALYKFMCEGPAILEEKQSQQAFDPIVGAAFSLWRAVFLTQKDRDWSSVSLSLEKFLYKVITDNSISYQDDKTNSAWTAGYYLDNADLRLYRAWEKLLKSPTLSEKALKAPMTFSETWEASLAMTALQWETTYKTTCVLFSLLNPDISVPERYKFRRVE